MGLKIEKVSVCAHGLELQVEEDDVYRWEAGIYNLLGNRGVRQGGSRGGLQVWVHVHRGEVNSHNVGWHGCNH